MAKQINDLNKSLEEQLHLNGKQDKTDNNLVTTDKTIVGAINELFQNVDSGKNIIADAIDVDGVTGDSTFAAMGEAIEGKNTEISNLKTELAGKVTPAGNAVAANVLSGKTFINSTGQTITGTMPNRGAYTASNSYVANSGTQLHIGIPQGAYLTNTSTGSPEIQVDNSKLNLYPQNIISGVTVGGVTGTGINGYRLVAGTDYTLATYNSGQVRTFSTTTYVKDSGTYSIALTFVGKGYTYVSELTIRAGSTTVYNGQLDNRNNGNGGYTTSIPYYINTNVTVNAGDTIYIYFNDSYYYHSISGSVTFSID